MNCAACNLHYPDHLSFCRRCGQPLVRSTSDPVMDSICCTRCGARTVRGENFCQQCGNPVATGGPETVVGACYHCGTSWRSAWLFCKTCGLDRDRALLLPTSSPALPSYAQKTLMTEVEELSQMARVFCKRCGAEAKPFSKYCETCGNTLDLSKEARKAEAAMDDAETAAVTEKSGALPATTVPETQTEPPPAKLSMSPSDRDLRPAVFEPPAADRRGGRRTDAIGESSLTASLAGDSEAAVASSEAEAQTETLVTSLPKTAPPAYADSSHSVRRSDSVGAWVVWMIIAVLALAAGLVAWRLLKNQQEQVSSASNQTAAQPAPESSPGVAPGAVQSASESAAAPEGMVYVPGGTFNQGREGGDEFESPAHAVTVKPFFIDRNEVTNEEYQRFVSAGHRAPLHWGDGKLPEGQAKFPVVNVSWDDAYGYAQWANKRLPTEAEWEFAARGTDERIYPWGSGWKEDYANVGRNKDAGLMEVGRFAAGASPFGALDMCGNVWEWTSSDYEDYPGRKTPSSLAGAGLKVIRGGAYDVPPKRATATYRGAIPPDRIPDKTGFRCARDVQ